MKNWTRLGSVLMLVSLVVTLLVSAPAGAGTIAANDPLVPAGLGVGDTFRLAFVSDNKRDADSNDISVYDAWIDAQAAAGSVTSGHAAWDWLAMMTTANSSDVILSDVKTHVVIGATTPVYNLAGDKVADGNADFWSNAHDGPMNVNENGGVLADPGGPNPWADTTWTGFNNDGNPDHMIGGSNGSYACGYAWSGVYWGLGNVGGYNNHTGVTLRVYGISEELTIIPVPEPASLGLLAAGGLALLRRRRH